MEAVAIRRVLVSDVERIKALRLRALRSDPASFASTFAREVAKPDEAWMDWASGDATGDERATMLALRGDYTIGLVRGYRDDDNRSLYHVIAMWVAPEDRGRGLGRKLLAAVEEWIASAGGTTVQLDVADTATEALSLYQSSGYLTDGRQSPSPHAPGITHLSLRKSLP